MESYIIINMSWNIEEIKQQQLSERQQTINTAFERRDFRILVYSPGSAGTSVSTGGPKITIW